MNVMAQTCGIIIIITLLIFYQSQKKLRLRTERMYSGMLHVSLFVFLFDLTSVHLIRFQDRFSPILVTLISKIYLVCLIAILAAGLIYINEDIFEKRKSFYANVLGQMAIITAGIIGIMLLPIYTFCDGDVIYTYGPSTLLTYGLAFYCICIIVALTVFFRRKMNGDRVKAVLLWMSTWCIAALVQFFVPQLLLVSFAVSVGMIILYIKLENPGMNIDRQSGIFNQNALIAYLKHKATMGKNVAIILFQTDKYGASVYENRFNWERLETLLDAKEGILFRKTEDSGVIVFDDEDKAREWERVFFEKIRNDEQDNFFHLRRAFWVSIYDTAIFEDVDEVLYYLRYIGVSHYMNGEQNEKNHIIAGKEEVAQMRQDKVTEILIDEAVENDRVEVFYQPIYSTEDERFTSAEALMRIRDAEGNIISPAQFIPIAEKTGKIITLGNMVFEKVCRFISESNLRDLGVDYIEVNLSPVQCSDDKLAETYIAYMEKYNVNPQCINLEITESATFRRKETVWRNITKLMESQITFSLDDFGTGHSNLNYIVDMPVDIVKFDRGMTGAFFVDAKAHYVVETAMAMIHGLGLKIVSEGIETKQQFETIRDMGISYVQGFYFSKPLPEQEFCQFIKQNNY